MKEGNRFVISMSLATILGTSIAASLLAIWPSKSIEGVVIEEFAKVEHVDESSIVRGEDLKCGEVRYGFVLENKDGRYVINVRPLESTSSSIVARMIEPGNIVRVNYENKNMFGFGRDPRDTIEKGIGLAYADSIEKISDGNWLER